jgi:N-acetyl-1-D-myo-inositol-2-amino-2-deoxy-alpha-D-glucopyranoside deacetylase
LLVSRRLLAVHAHPDDESLTMAGTLAGAVASGARVTLVTATLGEQGEVIGDELAGLVADRADQLGGYRYTELRSACAALGVADHRMLCGLGAFRDSGMAGTPSAAHPRAFVRAASGGPDHARAVAGLVEVIDETRPLVLLTYDADGGYGHPDHVAAHQVAMAAVVAATWRVPRVLGVVRPAAAFTAALAALAIPAPYRRVPAADLGSLIDDTVVAVAVPVAPWARHRRAALGAHATQVALFGDTEFGTESGAQATGFALSNGLGQPLADSEYFRVLAGDPVPASPGGEPASDVFAGLTDSLTGEAGAATGTSRGSL